MSTTEIQKFTEREAEMGARHAQSIRPVSATFDKRFLCERADLANQKLKQDPRLAFYQVMREVLGDIRDYETRQAYNTAIAKMLSERRVLQRQKVPA
ncbi:MAG: hypothetical protein B7X03_00230 [Parcubacteria group bacterium 21-58-10]|nr:MAG: hypothetical protein B7X03_00230 [Parcubacteria group bacterium 21-58-10]